MKSLSGFTALILALLLPLTQVRAADLDLDSAIDQLNYSLNVQWDQKDAKFHDQSIQAFEAELTQIQSQGVTESQILQVLRERMPDAQMARDLENLAESARVRNFTSQQIRQDVLSLLESSRTTGASWSDSSTVSVIGGSVVAAGLVVLLVWAGSHGHASASGNDPSTGGSGCLGRTDCPPL